MSAVLRDADSKIALTFDQLKAIAERVTYRHGWHLEVVECIVGIDVQWSGPIICSKTGMAGTITSRDCIGPVYSEEEFLQRSLASVMKVELHEAREFFKLDDKAIYDPHANGVQPFISIDHNRITLKEYLK